MIKKIIKFLSLLIIIIIIIIAYLSYFGVNTTKFNNKIKAEVSKNNKEINLEIKTVKLLLNLTNLSLNVKTLEPEIFFKNKKFKLKYIKTNIPLKSFINKNFSIDDLQMSTRKIKLKDLVQLARTFKNSAELFILNKIIKDGYLTGDINLNFDDQGKIIKDYEVKGFVKKGKLNILSKHSIKDLNFTFNFKDKEYLLGDIEATVNQVKLSSSAIEIKEKNNQFLVNGKLLTKKNNNIISLMQLLPNNFKDHGVESANFSSESKFGFAVSKKFKITNLKLESEIDLDSLLYKKNLPIVKKYFPRFRDRIKLEDHKILINYKKNIFNLRGEGNIFLQNKTDFLNYEVSQTNNIYNFNTIVNLNNNLVLLDFLNYKKKEDFDLTLKLKGSYKKNTKIRFDAISLIDEDKNKLIIEGLDLNNKFKIVDFSKLDLNFINNNELKNQVTIKKDKKKYKIYGKSIDATLLIDNILDSDNGNEPFSIFENLNSTLNINIEKTYIDRDSYVNNLKGYIIFENNKINKLSLKSTYPNQKELNITIITNKNKEKITTLFTDYPKPLIKRYKFIKGFAEGVLNFYSIKNDDVTNSTLIIDDFKVQEVPVLAKLLTLASLQGIADLLTGEGIRFTDLELKFTNKKGLMTIEEMYAIGPAISILMEGYIETKKLISLRGTLVPATTINRTIASIPLIGNILVGKKIGEGVFGVSYKVKGPPNNLKTTVNPIKTLTPRFITRTLEKIKKN